MKILLDNGHGIDTPGKRSNIKPFFEYEFNRDIVNRIAIQLAELNIDFSILVTEMNDISLNERVRRANAYVKKGKCLLVSIHANAGGGTGFEVFTTPGQNNSDKAAELFAKSFSETFPKEKLRVDLSDKDLDKEANFQIIKCTNCPAVLTESFFMDNKNDIEILTDPIERQKIADFHVNAIKKIVNG